MVGCNFWTRSTNTQSQSDFSDEQKPQKRSFCQALRKNFHWKCFALTTMIVGCLTLIIWCQITQYSYTHIPVSSLQSFHYAVETRKGPCEQGYNFIPIAFSVMLYVVYLMECWHCKTRLDLLCKVDVQSVYDYIDQLRQASPVVWWRAVCYHYLRRTRQVTRYRNGDTLTTTQVYYERINSHSAGSVFLYHDAGVKDVSKKLLALEQYPVTKIRFTKGFVFANLQSANEFEEQRARFFQENEQRDDYMEVREGLDLVSGTFKEHMAAFADINHRPWFLSQWCFWLCSFMLASWPLRILIEYKTAYVHFQVTKLFGSNYLSPTNTNYTGPLTRVSTMDSRDLEMVLQNTFVMVPSYSEALLMDPVHSRTIQMMQDRDGNLHIQTRRHFIVGNSADAVNNERVFANYGALIREELPPLPCPRSRSMSFQRLSNGVLGRPSANNRDRTSRSISFGSLANITGPRHVYRTLPTTPEDAERDVSNSVPDDPPPSYDTALQMCQPLYERIRRSTVSESRFKWFTSFTSGIRDKSNSSKSKDDDTLL